MIYNKDDERERNMKTKLGIVIINYNDYETTKRLLENIKNYKCLEKIVIVDNNSTDDSLKKLKEFESNKITIIKNSNRHFASGLNVGAKYLIKKVGKCNIIFSNSDIIIKSENDLKQLSSDIGKKIGVVGPVIYEHGNLNRGWKLPSANQEILFNLPFISRYFKKKFLYYNEQMYKANTVKVDVVSGCFFVVSSSMLERIGFFDENTFLYYEEQIFAQKVKNQGYEEVIDTQVQIIHDHSVTIDKNVNKIRKYRILKSSQKYFVKKYLKANILQNTLLYITNKLSLIILYIRVYLGGRK